MDINWKLREADISFAELHKFSSELNISPVMCLMLHQRGMKTLEDMHFFLNPGLRYLPPLETWSGLDKASRIIGQALDKDRKMAVWGDYDVDGITSVALIKDFFQRRGIDVIPKLPHRVTDGYGLNSHEIENLAREGVRVLITVDCGISNLAEINRAKELGMQVVLTDHHQPGQNLPRADVILNPKTENCPHPNLAGVGTAFFLVAALNRTLPGPALDMRDFLDLVALGTIADLVELDRSNRILVKNGLLLLNNSLRPGINALKEVSGLEDTGTIGAGEVGFALGPRINAAGRLDDPAIALELLLTSNISLAGKLAQQLNRLNDQRKKTENEILSQAREMALSMQDQHGLVLYGPDWHPGVIGIVASRIVDEFHRPCFVLTRDNGLLKGSGRSIQGYNLYHGLSELASFLEKFGGHSQAAGLSLDPDRLEEFRDGFNKNVRRKLGPAIPRRTITLDAMLELPDITPELLMEIEMLQPLGPGNPRPVFLSNKLLVMEQTLFGKNRHVRFTLKDEPSGICLKAIFWRKGQAWSQRDLKGKRLTLAYTPAVNTYRGVTGIRLNIREILQVAD
ncbi:MAG: single-stranded-DNA-specific exonuclease RecJ [Desulfonatronovibrionaceae bacterium]